MKIAHLADTHLGYRRGDRSAPGGMNQWEQDVAGAFRQALDSIIAARPDAVIHAGDLFHKVNPPNACALFCYQQFRRLREALPDTPIILIAGNHEAPKLGQTGSPLSILAEIGVHVATRTPQTFTFPGLTVVAVPYPALREEDRSWMEPTGEGHRVLAIHGVVDGVVPTYPGAPVIPKELMQVAGWSYIALGDWHGRKQLGPRAWYAGSTGFASSDVWHELAPPKAWLLVDLETGAVEPHPIPMARPIHDLPPIDGNGLEPAELQAAIAAAITGIPGGITGAIVRLTVLDVTRPVARQLDHAAIRKWKDPALHFRLDIRKPVTHSVGSAISRASGRRQTLPELIAEYLGKRELPPGIDRLAFVKLGAELMSEDDYCGGTREERAAAVG